ncbi:MAG: LytTR family DNA-binding domain-containing protein [Pseudomonadota bacterium]|nr:LytTR family DNA-binding domain-containing protein [Pseudomonadota bacterium]
MSRSEPSSLTALVVDDEKLAREGLAMRLKALGYVDILRQCENGRAALRAIAECEPDVVFLDIQMPGISGFDLVSQMQGDAMPIVVFVTAFDAFAVDAFQVHAVDYLLKPVEQERLEAAVNRCFERRAEQAAAADKQKLLEMVVSLSGKSEDAIRDVLLTNDLPENQIDRLAIKDGASTSFVPIRDIDWIDAAGDYMCVHVGNRTHIMRTTMKELESRLDASVFQRVHRSTIVNLERVEKVSSHINGEYYLTLIGGSTLKMSRSYKNKVKHFFPES